ncbi:sugar kinase [Bacteroides sp.]|uniref:sugar kinase n=1 Tax=Bacteroides sp. TaxID=29523 RepID=UPI002585926F|nr:sugar kinase [Bacteroides sp.]
MMNKVVTFGEIMLRLGAPDYLRLAQCHQLDMSFAGAEANVAVSLANYGIPVEYVTRLPENPIADKCLSELLSCRVNVDHILRGGKRIGLLYLETGSNVRPSKVYYDREHSSFATITTNSIDWEKIFKDACWFHWTGITPALSENAAKVCLEAIKVAKQRGMTISCDLNYRKNLWSSDRKASDIMPSLVQACDVIIGNEEDCSDVFGIRAKGFNAEQTNGDIDAGKFASVCSQMQSRFSNSKVVALTLRGSLNANHNTWQGVLFAKNCFYHSSRYDITHIVDRVGGGDSFSGGLIYGLLTWKDDLQHALDFAVAASCLKHTIYGDFNRVSLKEVELLMAGELSGRVKR